MLSSEGKSCNPNITNILYNKNVRQLICIERSEQNVGTFIARATPTMSFALALGNITNNCNSKLL